MGTEIVPSNGLALRNAISLWADSTTDDKTDRRKDLIRDKVSAVSSFFQFTGKHPGQVTPMDIEVWRSELEGKGLSPSTVYARISRVSSWYDWALSDPNMRQVVYTNPVNLARPKAPKPYQNESTKSLDDEEARALIEVVRTRAESGDVVGKRDYAILLMFLATGMRRREVISLKWGDVKINGTLVITCLRKGGDFDTVEVKLQSVKTALLDYLSTSGRLSTMQPDSPLWISHDRGPDKGKDLSSHGFAKNLKQYGEKAGIGDIHVHQTRHTAARIVNEERGLGATQTMLGHKTQQTTRVYIQRVSVKKDEHSSAIAARLGL